MRKTTVAKLVSAAALTASVVSLAAGPALADPPSGTTPAATDIVGVGSDTVQALFNQLSTDYTGTPKLYSWDATGTSPITTKTGATSITRPNGSGAGITALGSTTSSTVDFARSSRGPQTGDPTTDDFIAYAKDAVSWAAKSGGDAPANLTKADLQGIYACTITKWNQITDISGFTGSANTIQPFLPQSGSGTRSFFLSSTGITTIGSCVNQTVEENEGSNTLLQTNDSVVPYSVGHYIGQVYFSHGSGTDVQGPLTVRNLDGIVPIDTTNKTISSAYAVSAYSRNLYNVVRAGDWNAGDSHATALKAIFSSTGWICKNATAQADLKSYGFLPLALCGVISHT
ncbi:MULTISPECIES: PstS family phosphate ABC transporter substrate-binding protein [Streptacidiphilus]|uniref:PstS family phosphate ABC transporter substrate-binding protein n=2 Tax=Streptacidiphilus TaxID=228398 RepID=A0ABV6USJ6_9ACTN|nr:substrate-binding domain-containing protein [Streptacidiphilus jeojiense]